ncbi:MAG: sugar porter family MFS transporter [Pseudoclavibacter sp.]
MSTSAARTTLSPEQRVRTIVFVATMGAIGFGYDTGVISGALPFMTLSPSHGGIGLTPVTEGVVTSSLVFGAAVGAFFAGRLADGIGRRRSLQILAVGFFIGAIGTALSPNVPVMVVFRVVLGLAVGGASTVVPIFIAEVAPPSHRDRLVSRNELMIVTGQLLAYVFNAIIVMALSEATGVWRLMLLICALPPVLLFVGMLFVPESPRWVAAHGNPKHAWAILRRLRHRSELHREVAAITASIEVIRDEPPASWRDLATPWIRRLILIGMAAGAAQQLSGVNSVMYFAPTILQRSGLGAQAAIVSTIGNGAVAVAATLVGMRFAGRFGRRPMMLTGLGGVICAHALLGLVFLLPSSFGRSMAILGLMMVLLFFIQAMISVVYWLLMSEMFPLRIRGFAAGVSVAASWIANGVVALLFPMMLHALGGTSFFVFAVINVVSFVVIFLVLPETHGKSLEQLETEFRGASRAPESTMG